MSALVLLFGFLYFGESTSEVIQLIPGQVHHFTAPGYPNVQQTPGNVTYSIHSSPGSKIIAYCEDFRVAVPLENPCAEFRMTLFDGVIRRNYCEFQRDINFFSSGNSLMVEMMYERGQLVSCLARSTEDPEPTEIVLTATENQHEIVQPENPVPYFHKVWVVKSSTNSKVSLSCATSFFEKPLCFDEVMIIDTGSEVTNFCGAKRMEFVSMNEEIRIKVVLNKYGWSRFSCWATIPEIGGAKPSDEIPKIPKKFTNTTLRAGQVHEFTSPGYDDEFSPGYVVFNFNTAPNAKIILTCDDFRVVASEDPCQHCEIKFDDGKNIRTVCEQQQKFYHVSETNVLSVEMKYDRAPLISCVARTTEEPMANEAVLDVQDGIYEISNPSNAVPFYDAIWIFHGAEGTRISLQCSLSLHEFPSCYIDRFTIDTGNDVIAYCRSEDVVHFSAERTIKVRVQLDKYGDSRFNCKAQAVTGPNADQHLNLVSAEIDSSEFGDSPGSIETTCDCGRRNQDAQRIFHGNETKVGEYPWMVAIRDYDNSQRCGGSIITSWHVLTAAHCMVDVHNRNKNEIWDTVIYIGVHNRSIDNEYHGESQIINITDTFIPEEWWAYKKPYDVAVLVLKEEIKFLKYVGPVCMPKIGPKIVNTQIKVTGWGQTHEGSSSPVLLETKLFVLDKISCNMDKSLICTYSKRTSVCFGDSGSPMVHLDKRTNRYTQVSIVSFGYSCISRSGSSNVTYHHDWIKSIVERTVPTAKMCYRKE